MIDPNVPERDPDHAYRTLLRILSAAPADHVVSADSFRDDTDAAQLTSAEKSGALTRAMNDGYLTALVAHNAAGEPYVFHGQRVLGSVTSNRGKGKGGRVLLYVRTDSTIPGHPCQVAVEEPIEGQVDLLELIGEAAAS